MIEAEPLHPTAPAAAGHPPAPAADGRARREGDADVERVQLDSEARTHRNRLRIATLAFWSLLGLLESAIAYVRLSGSPREQSWLHALYGNMPWWLLWAALMPVVAWLVRRTPLDGGRWWRAAGVHLVAAPIVASVHLLVEGAVYYYSVSRYLGMVPSLEQQWRNFFANYLMIDVVTYAVIAGAAYAYEFHTSFRNSQLRSTRLELGLAEARMQALRTELNPHFFFNALNAVSGLVRRRENDAAVRMLARLGELLRTTLDRDLAPEIPLREELALLDRYLDIERVRFGDRLRIDVREGPDVRDALVPTLLLQPIVENAVRHGVSVQTGPARIEVSAARDGQWLRIVVRNWGRGVSPDAAAGRREGIGLSNTRARLSALYGERASLALEGLDDGARVAITLPFRRDTETETETRTEARDVAASA